MKVTIEFDTSVPADARELAIILERELGSGYIAEVSLAAHMKRKAAAEAAEAARAAAHAEKPDAPEVGQIFHVSLGDVEVDEPVPVAKPAAMPSKAKPKTVELAGGLAKLATPAAKPAVAPADAQAIAERGKAMTKATKALTKAVGVRSKLSPSDKAKVAAAARWSGHKKVKGPTVRQARAPKDASRSARDASVRSKKPATRPEPKPLDYTGAEEQPLTSFVEEAGAEVRMPGAPPLEAAPAPVAPAPEEDPVPPYPDGRELIEGSFRLPPELDDQPALEGEDHEREIAAIAREFGALPDDLDVDGPAERTYEPVSGV